MIVRKLTAPNVDYEGVIIDTNEINLIVVKFGDDFVETFDHTRYSVEFICSRSYFIRQHFAIDLAFELYGTNILLPTDISLRGEPLVKKCQKGQIVWINDKLNLCQKQAIKQIIGGDFLNPYLIFGPPGMFDFSST